MMKVLAATVLLAGGLLTGAVHAAEFTLRLHSYMPAGSYQEKKFFEPWCARIKEQSGGRMECAIYPSMQLGGSPAEMIDQARDGIVDLAYANPGYSPGKYLTAELFELPFLILDPHQGSRAVYEFLTTEGKDEFAGVRIIATGLADHVMIQTVDKPVRTLADLKGLKLRGSSRVVSKAVEALGALPVQMPGNAIAESLTRGVIDGAMLPWSGVRLLNIGDIVHHYTDFSDGQRKLSYAPNILVMGQSSYDKLPDDLKKVIDDNSGPDESAEFTDAFDTTRLEDRDIVSKAGGDVHDLPDDEYQRWVEATAGISAGWIADAEAKGYDGQALLDRAKDLLGSNSN